MSQTIVCSSSRNISLIPSFLNFCGIRNYIDQCGLLEYFV